MDFNLTEDQRMLVESVTRFANTKVREIAAQMDLDAKMDPSVYAAATELGLPLDAVPAAHGGYLEGKYSRMNRAVRAETIGSADAASAHALESATDLAILLGGASEAVQKTWFPKLVEKEFSTAALIGTTGEFKAAKSGDGWSLTGSQSTVLLAGSASFWVIKADGPDGALLFVTDGPPQSAQVVPVDNTGFRACDTGDVSLTDVKVGAENVIAEGSAADELWDDALANARLTTAAIGVGLAQATIDFAQKYADERVQFERPIAKFQAIAQMLEESKSAIAAARLLVYQNASRLDAGEKLRAEVETTKSHVAKVVTRATIDSVQVLGGYGFVNDYPVERYYRDARVIETLYGRDLLNVLLDIQAS